MNLYKPNKQGINCTNTGDNVDRNNSYVVAAIG